MTDTSLEIKSNDTLLDQILKTINEDEKYIKLNTDIIQHPIGMLLFPLDQFYSNISKKISNSLNEIITIFKDRNKNLFPSLMWEFTIWSLIESYLDRNNQMSLSIPGIVFPNHIDKLNEMIKPDNIKVPNLIIDTEKKTIKTVFMNEFIITNTSFSPPISVESFSTQMMLDLFKKHCIFHMNNIKFTSDNKSTEAIENDQVYSYRLWCFLKGINQSSKDYNLSKDNILEILLNESELNLNLFTKFKTTQLWINCNPNIRVTNNSGQYIFKNLVCVPIFNTLPSTSKNRFLMVSVNQNPNFNQESGFITDKLSSIDVLNRFPHSMNEVLIQTINESLPENININQNILLYYGDISTESEDKKSFLLQTLLFSKLYYMKRMHKYLYRKKDPTYLLVSDVESKLLPSYKQQVIIDITWSKFYINGGKHKYEPKLEYSENVRYFNKCVYQMVTGSIIALSSKGYSKLQTYVKDKFKVPDIPGVSEPEIIKEKICTLIETCLDILLSEILLSIKYSLKGTPDHLDRYFKYLQATGINQLIRFILTRNFEVKINDDDDNRFEKEILFEEDEEEKENIIENNLSNLNPTNKPLLNEEDIIMCLTEIHFCDFNDDNEPII